MHALKYRRHTHAQAHTAAGTSGQGRRGKQWMRTDSPDVLLLYCALLLCCMVCTGLTRASVRSGRSKLPSKKDQTLCGVEKLNRQLPVADCLSKKKTGMRRAETLRHDTTRHETTQTPATRSDTHNSPTIHPYTPPYTTPRHTQ